MPRLIDIQGDTVRLSDDKQALTSVKVQAFVDALVQQSERPAFPGMLIDGMRFVRMQGPATAVCLELPPQVRTVRWLDDASPADFGRRAQYQQVRLAFPYMVVLVAFWNGALSGQQQLYYRSAPIASEADTLFFPNLYNVAEAYGQLCWLCLQKLGSLATVPWESKLRRIVEHLWSAFNRSSEVHEGNSYWGKMSHLDRRLQNVAAWQCESEQNPLFVLSVPWQSANVSIRQIMDEQLAATTRSRPLATDKDLLAVLLRTQKS
jgi:hypothetical protein